MRKKVIGFIILVFLVSGCTSAKQVPTSTAAPKPTNTPDALAATRLAIQATHTPRPPTAPPVSPTNTPVPPTPTDTATSPPTEIPQPTDMSTLLPPLTGSGGGVIAFVSKRDGNFEIYVMNADGSDQRRLTHNDADDWAPAWSPDGTQLAFSSERDGNFEIYVMDLSDGIGARTADQDPPDQRRLTYREANDWDPDWSPDGTQLIFHSERGDQGFDIWLMNADGSDTRRLTNTAYDEIHLAWSPDGSRFAFESTFDGNYQIYVIAADSRAPGSLDQQRLTSHVAGNRFPDWSPDGSQIAFSSMRDGNNEIYVMDADGRNKQRLTVNDGEDWDPTWSPDGTQIAFRSRRDGNWEIYAMNADGSNQRRLTNTSADDHYPAWRLAMESAKDSQAHAVGDTWIRPADGMTMVYVPAGQFEMGSNDDDVGYAMQLCNEYRDDCQRQWYENEQPVHMVALDGFWIDKYEVTNAQYQMCVEAGGCQAPTTCNWGTPTYGKADKADHPVVCVDWQGAQDYCEWAGGRLPTEAEWEYAARGAARNVFPWGDTFDGTLANFCDTNCTQDWKNSGYDDGYSQTAPVGSYPDGISWCGAEDMAGNVWERVSDWYDSDYYRVSPAENPVGPSSGEYRVARGGSWRDGSLPAAFRYYSGVPSLRTSNVGVRCGSAIRSP
jgi:Tol biopolymer transport system component